MDAVGEVYKRDCSFKIRDQSNLAKRVTFGKEKGNCRKKSIH